MTTPYDAVLRAARASTGPGQELELNRATSAMNELLGRISDLQQAEYEGWDSLELIRARVTGTGRLTGVDIGARAIRAIPTAQLGAHCIEAIGAARAAMAEAVREGLGAMSGAEVRWDEGPVDPVGHLRDRIAEQR